VRNDDWLNQALNKALREFDCVAGTIHVLEENDDVMKLAAHRGIPDVVLDKVRDVPIGKGMAGLAAERRQPVQICNLQTDESGVAKPTARETKMAGSIAAPMIASNGSLKGTIGIAKPVPYDFSADECERLMRIGTRIAQQLADRAKT
jgi:L-methionine (R)-S-oxide reductase